MSGVLLHLLGKRGSLANSLMEKDGVFNSLCNLTALLLPYSLFICRNFLDMQYCCIWSFALCYSTSLWLPTQTTQSQLENILRLLTHESLKKANQGTLKSNINVANENILFHKSMLPCSVATLIL